MGSTVHHMTIATRTLDRVLGTNQAIILTGDQTGGGFTLIEQVETQGAGIPMHVHQHEDETFYVTEGTVQLVVGTEHLALNKGDVAICPRGIPHSWQITEEAGARFLVLITPAGLEQMFNELADLMPPPDFDDVHRICGKYGISFIAG